MQSMRSLTVCAAGGAGEGGDGWLLAVYGVRLTVRAAGGAGEGGDGDGAGAAARGAGAPPRVRVGACARARAQGVSVSESAQASVLLVDSMSPARRRTRACPRKGGGSPQLY